MCYYEIRSDGASPLTFKYNIQIRKSDRVKRKIVNIIVLHEITILHKHNNIIDLLNMSIAHV